jgi:hypothetical protein
MVSLSAVTLVGTPSIVIHPINTLPSQLWSRHQRAPPLLCIASTGIAQAHADEPWFFAQITCAPELGYFSIRKILIMNLPHGGPYLRDGFMEPPPLDVVSALEEKNRIYDSEGLSARPFTCRSPHLADVPGSEREREGFEVRVVGHNEKPDDNESRYCRMVYNAEVIVNGKSAGLLVLNPCGNGPMLVSVEIAHDGVQLAIRRCTHDFADDVPAQERVVCREEPLAKGQRQKD